MTRLLLSEQQYPIALLLHETSLETNMTERLYLSEEKKIKVLPMAPCLNAVPLARTRGPQLHPNSHKLVWQTTLNV